jgi:flagellar basal body-associated protein FliL
MGNESREKVASRPFAGRLPRVIALVLGLVILVAAAVGLCFWIGRHKNLGLKNSQSGNVEEKYLEVISLTELSQHADPLNDCWLAIHGFVWDLTDYGMNTVASG